jgi:beta-1,4-mannosyl-glycoprotein beta-1,4-N-acetylglucosaminyltransferase
MIYEGFMFFNELDILEIHLQEMDCLVDKFIIVESHIKHDGGRKPLYYADNISRFFEFRHKIIHIVTDDIERLNENKLWCSRQERDDTNRNHIKQGLKNANPNDIFIHSDVDEIADTVKLKDILSSSLFDPTKIYCCQMKQFNYFFNLFVRNKIWQGSTITTVGNLSTVLALRNARLDGQNIMIPNCGWHLTYMGSPETILNKLRTMTDTEGHTYTIEEVREFIKEKKDLDRLAQSWRQISYMEFVDPSWLPKYILNNIERFAQYIGAE